MTRAITGLSGIYTMLNGQVLTGRTANNFGEFYYYTSGTRISRTLSTIPEGEEVSNGNGESSAVVRCVKDNPAAKHSSSSDFNEGGEG